MKYWILSCFLVLSAHAGLVPCGQHELELTHPSLVWKQFTNIQVRSRFADLDGIICVGKVPQSPVAQVVTYRDADNRTQVIRTVEELNDFQVLITSADLPAGVGGVVRSGDIVSLKIGAPTEYPEISQTHYPVFVRFHRALARGSASDIRELEFVAHLDYINDLPTPVRQGKAFDTIKIFISALPPRMEQIVLKQADATVDNFFTSTLSRVNEL